MFLIVGILLAATAVDANGCLFPLAHAVVDAENDDNWLWFLQLLFTVVQSHALQSLIDKSLVFLSDRQKGLLHAVDAIFPGCPHSRVGKEPSQLAEPSEPATASRAEPKISDGRAERAGILARSPAQRANQEPSHEQAEGSARVGSPFCSIHFALNSIKNLQLYDTEFTTYKNQI